MIESGAYEQKPISGSTHNLVSVWLYWKPKPPPDVSTPTPTPRRPAKKGVKKGKGAKAEKEVKAEKGVKAEPFVETSSAYLRRGVSSETLYSHMPTG